jgi:hypothetical protein
LDCSPELALNAAVEVPDAPTDFADTGLQAPGRARCKYRLSMPILKISNKYVIDKQ